MATLKVGVDRRPRSSWTHLAAAGSPSNPLSDYDVASVDPHHEQIENARALHEAYRDLFRAGKHAGPHEIAFEDKRRERGNQTEG